MNIKSPTFPMIFKIVIPSENMRFILTFEQLDHFFKMFPDRELLEYEVYPACGLQDINGFEIFEGDTVTFDFKEGLFKQGTIEYSPYEASFGIAVEEEEIFFTFMDLLSMDQNIQFTLVEE